MVDFGARVDGLGQPYVCADDAVCADDGFSAQDGGVGIDGDAVFEGGVSFFCGAFAFFGHVDAERAQGDALIQFDIVADGAGFTDDDACAVIDEEAVPDLGAGMDVDAGFPVCDFAHHAREDGDAGQA